MLPFLEESNPFFEIVSSPQRERIELISAHVERHLKVGVVQMLLQVAAINVWRHFVVASEQLRDERIYQNYY